VVPFPGRSDVDIRFAVINVTLDMDVRRPLVCAILANFSLVAPRAPLDHGDASESDAKSVTGSPGDKSHDGKSETR
jgi:hypothetical protein